MQRIYEGQMCLSMFSSSQFSSGFSNSAPKISIIIPSHWTYSQITWCMLLSRHILIHRFWGKGPKKIYYSVHIFNLIFSCGPTGKVINVTATANVKLIAKINHAIANDDNFQTSALAEVSMILSLSDSLLARLFATQDLRDDLLVFPDFIFFHAF